ncbi:MAG: cytochrome c [Pirellulales bacterium]
MRTTAIVRTAIALCTLAAITTAWFTLLAQQPSRGKPPAALPERARPPQWTERSKSAFFENAGDALVGARPDYGNRPSESPSSPSGNPGDGSSSAGGVFAWSKIVAPETIEDEVKRIANGINEAVVNPQQYAGGGYKAGQDHFSMLAVLFAIVAEYDGEVRWQRHAIAAREEFAAAGFGSRVGSIQAFNQAKGAREDLTGMIGGQTLKGKDGEAKAEWGKVAYRPPLMRRLKIGQEERLNGWTASAGEFKKHTDEILHEAQLVAALAEVITRDGFEYADDATYVGFCKELKKSALDVVDAVKQNNAANARSAMSAMGKTCTACHDGYRG